MSCPPRGRGGRGVALLLHFQHKAAGKDRRGGGGEGTKVEEWKKETNKRSLEYNKRDSGLTEMGRIDGVAGG